tara:strand:+ start:231 stop:380 length:150 start_codon:yes stop_codon:yes gene_type:complete
MMKDVCEGDIGSENSNNVGIRGNNTHISVDELFTNKNQFKKRFVFESYG